MDMVFAFEKLLVERTTAHTFADRCSQAQLTTPTRWDI